MKRYVVQEDLDQWRPLVEWLAGRREQPPEPAEPVPQAGAESAPAPNERQSVDTEETAELRPAAVALA